MAKTGLMQNNPDSSTNTIPIEMIAWDDLVIYANALITALNDLRFSLSVNQINDIFNITQSSFNQLALWLDGFMDEDLNVAKRAARIFVDEFVPFIQSHFKSAFLNPILDKWLTSDMVNQDVFTFKINSKVYDEIKDDEEEESFATIQSTQPSTYETDSASNFGSEMIHELQSNFANMFQSEA